MTFGTGAQVRIGTDAPPEYSAWVTTATNLYTNPSFENAGAIPAGATQSSDWAARGTYSLYIAPSAAPNVFTSSFGANF